MPHQQRQPRGSASAKRATGDRSMQVIVRGFESFSFSFSRSVLCLAGDSSIRILPAQGPIASFFVRRRIDHDNAMLRPGRTGENGPGNLAIDFAADSPIPTVPAWQESVWGSDCLLTQP